MFGCLAAMPGHLLEFLRDSEPGLVDSRAADGENAATCGAEPPGGQTLPKPDNTPEESIPSKEGSTSSGQVGQKVVPKLSGPTRFGAGVVMHPGDQGNASYGPAVVGQTGEVPIPLGMRPPSKEWQGMQPDQINMMFQFRMDAVRQVTLIGLILVQLFFFRQSTV